MIVQNYEICKSVNDYLRYSSVINLDQIYNLTCANYIKTLKNHKYSGWLSIAQRAKLNSLINQLIK
jgi:hypothetical protein